MTDQADELPVRFLFQTGSAPGPFSILILDGLTDETARAIAEDERQRRGPCIVTRADQRTKTVETWLVGFEPVFCSKEGCSAVCAKCARYSLLAKSCDLCLEERGPGDGEGCSGFVCMQVRGGREKAS